MTVQGRCRSCLENHPAYRPNRGVMFQVCFFLHFSRWESMDKMSLKYTLFTNHWPLSPQQSPTTDMLEVPLSWNWDWERRNMNSLLIISQFFIFLMKDIKKVLGDEEWCSANLPQYSGKGQPSTLLSFQLTGKKATEALKELLFVRELLEMGSDQLLRLESLFFTNYNGFINIYAAPQTVNSAPLI